MRRRGHVKTLEKSIPGREKIKYTGSPMAMCASSSKGKGQPVGPEQGERGKERRGKS